MGGDDMASASIQDLLRDRAGCLLSETECPLRAGCPGNGAAWAVTWARGSCPAVAAQCRGEQCSALAGALGDAYRAEAAGLHAIHGEVEVVADPVGLSAVALVRAGAVDFDRHLVLGVPVVLVVRLAAKRAGCLAPRLGQAVCALDVPDVVTDRREASRSTAITCRAPRLRG